MLKDLVRRILVATDCSKGAASAERYALLLATSCQAALDILHVLEFQPGMDPDLPVNRLYLEERRNQAAPRLGELVARAKDAGVTAVSLEQVGWPSERIVACAKDHQADLVVLGTHGRTGVERILLGSTAERVITLAPCPVLTVRRDQSRAVPAIRHILAPVDFSDCSLEALEYAVSAAKQFGAALTVLHVVEPVAYGLDFTLGGAEQGHVVRARWQTRLKELTAPLEAQGLTAEPLLSGGVPSDVILARARERWCDLIVMGTHGRRGFSHLVSGSVAEAVVRRAECPVVTVKSPKFERRRT